MDRDKALALREYTRTLTAYGSFLSNLTAGLEIRDLDQEEWKILETHVDHCEVRLHMSYSRLK